MLSGLCPRLFTKDVEIKCAGYYNTREVNGYEPICQLFKGHDAMMIFTCFEMRNHETLEWAYCAPEGLVNQVLEEAWRQGIEISTENALPRYDRYAYDQVTLFTRLLFSSLFKSSECHEFSSYWNS